MFTLNQILDGIKTGSIAFFQNLSAGNFREMTAANPELWDLIIVMSAKYREDRYDWLVYLEYVSPENQENALHWLVNTRLTDSANPTWLYLACEYATKMHWDIPHPWIEELRASVALGKIRNRRYEETGKGYCDTMVWFAEEFLTTIKEEKNT